MIDEPFRIHQRTTFPNHTAARTFPILHAHCFSLCLPVDPEIGEGSPMTAANEAEPDHDGTSNLLERMIHLNPSQPGDPIHLAVLIDF